MANARGGDALLRDARTFRALRHRDFALFWTAQAVSLSGSWMQSVAQGWLVLRLSNSPLALGWVGFSAFLPVLLFTLVGGVAADRLPRRRLLLVTQALAMAQAAGLAILTGTGAVQVWHVCVFAFALGTVNAFDIPIRQSLFLDLVGRDDLPNAIALNAAAFNGARLVGPSVAGLVLAAYGETACFALNAVSFLAVLAGLALVRVPRTRPVASGRSWSDGVVEGIRFAWRTRTVRAVLGTVAVSAIFGMPYSVLMPAFARDVLHGDQRTLGFLMGATGAGAVLGALAVAGRRSTRRAGRIVGGSMAVFGAAIAVLSLARSFLPAAAALVVVGAAMIGQMSTANAWLQLESPPLLRGRVVSLYVLMFLGMSPFGSLLGGWVAGTMGTPWALGLGGAVCLLGAVAFLARFAPVERTTAGSGLDTAVP